MRARLCAPPTRCLRKRGSPWRRSAACREASDILVLGPAEAPIAMVRGRYRFRILVKTPKRLDLQGFPAPHSGRRAASARGGIRVDVDVDPQSFL